MSSFSSVVQKPGKKIVPKAAPRRNVQRKPQISATTAATPPTQSTSEEQTLEQAIDSTEVPVLPSADVAPVEQAEQSSEPEVQRPGFPSETTSQHSGNEAISQRNAPEVELASTPPEPRQVPRNATPVEINSEEVQNEAAEQHSVVDTAVEDATAADLVQQPIPETVASGAVEASPSGASQDQRTANAPSTRSKRQRKTTEPAEDSQGSNKRRKTVSRTTPGSAVVRTPTRSVRRTQQTSSPETRVSPSAEDVSPPADDLFQSATRRAATVSELANSIDPQRRSLRPRAGQNDNEESHVSQQDENSEPTQTSTSRSTRKRRTRTVEEQAAEIVANAMGKGKGKGSAHRRDSTPENAEDYELEPTKVTMGELCEDKRIGKKSTLETEMEANWPEILQRRKEDRERALVNAEKRRRKGLGHTNPVTTNDEPIAALAPSMTVVNGVIVVDQASREIDRAAQLQQAAGQNLNDVREDRDYYKYVNQNTVGMKSGGGRPSSWDEDATERFYKGLRMFGTDFLMIANMFPGFSRKQIKSKFIREENTNPSRVVESLHKREPVELDDYAAMANKESEEYQTLESLQKELDAQEAKLRDEDNERRKREGFVTADKDNNGQPSTTEEVVETIEGQTASAEPGRFDAAAQEIIAAAMGGSKKKTRKSNAANSKRGAKGGKRVEGGVEEMLGSIDDFDRR